MHQLDIQFPADAGAAASGHGGGGQLEPDREPLALYVWVVPCVLSLIAISQ